MLYFLRHAQSIANQSGIYAGGSLDSHLSEEGIQKFSDYVSTNTLKFDIIYVSELSRSIESGKLFANLQKEKINIISDARINELDFGKLTGHKYISFDTENIYKKFQIESKESFHSRVNSFYKELIKKDLADKNILIVGHSGVGKMLYTIVNSLPYERYNSYQRFDDYEVYLLQ